MPAHAGDRRMGSLEYDERYSGGGSIPPLPCETESMRPLGACTQSKNPLSLRLVAATSAGD
eukprot:scaffold10474_cov122-Isochrysis_galbana.AAC.7